MESDDAGGEEVPSAKKGKRDNDEDADDSEPPSFYVLIHDLFIIHVVAKGTSDPNPSRSETGGTDCKRSNTGTPKPEVSI